MRVSEELDLALDLGEDLTPRVTVRDGRDTSIVIMKKDRWDDEYKLYVRWKGKTQFIGDVEKTPRGWEALTYDYVFRQMGNPDAYRQTVGHKHVGDNPKEAAQSLANMVIRSVKGH